MKKVLQFNFTGSWEHGGCLSHIVRAWVRNSRNYEHDFASWAGPDFSGKMEGRPHFSFHENRMANKIFNKILGLKKLCFFDLVPIIEKVRPDILHFHNRHDLVDKIMAKLSYRPKVVCLYHCYYNDLYIPATADLLIGVGKSVVIWIDGKASPSVPMAVLHNPFERVPIPETRRKPKTTFFSYSNHPMGVRDLFAAVKVLQTEGFEFEVRTVGRVYRELTPPPGVTATPAVPQPKFMDLLENSSAFISIAYGTTFSVAVLEAAARKIPVLCPWDIGVLDLLPTDCVISYESHSASAMADAMRRFLRMSEDERNALAERALAAVEVYDEAILTEKLERLYDGLYRT
jgi:glycosyltransferase involved in cell wall biosynthesis